jgi:uncharacterized protein (DUF302 family)
VNLQQTEKVNPTKSTRIVVEHVQVQTEKPFQDATNAFDRQLGHFDPDVLKELAEGGDVEKAKAKMAAMAGPSSFMLMNSIDHGALLRVAGQERKANQYVLGNPLFAFQMTQHDIRASLYAPLRVLLYENDAGKTCVEYDKPSSLFGQFENAEITLVASMLDHKLEALVASAIG